MSEPKKCYSSPCGDWGSRIRVAERKPEGVLYLLWVGANGRQQKRSLGHKNKARAKNEALELSESVRVAEGRTPVQLTVGTLIDNFMARGLTGRSKSYVSDKRRQLERWRQFLDPTRPVCSLSPSHVKNFMDHRKKTAVKPLTKTTLWHDWKALDIALNFASRERDWSGKRILESNPLFGQVKMLKTASPLRPVASISYFVAIWEVRADLPWQFEMALVLAHETGHRIGAILKLSWADVSLGALPDEPHGAIHWRGENDKVENDHRVAITVAARDALVLAKSRCMGSKGAWVFPAPDSPGPLDRRLTTRWLKRAEKLAGIEHLQGQGWHSFRRQWASDRLALPDVVVAAAGGWKDTATMKLAYQQPSALSVLKAVCNTAA